MARPGKMREKHQCNIPWPSCLTRRAPATFTAPGCWAAEYGNKLNLSFDDIDSIIEQEKSWVSTFTSTPAESPLVRKKDVIALCEKHADCTFLSFTNATLIDEDFCQDMLRVKNFVPAISVEASSRQRTPVAERAPTQRSRTPWSCLNSTGFPSACQCCYTSQNASSIASEAYFDWMVEQGVLFCWIFTYMPVGVNAPTDLMASAEQRKTFTVLVRDMRSKKPLFTLDFWNDRRIRGRLHRRRRRYLHINAAGDVEPCVFAHYSNANIHDVSLLEALKSPLFMGVLRKPALRRQPAASLPHPGQHRTPRRHGGRDGRPLYRPGARRERARPLRKVRFGSGRMEARGRKPVERPGRRSVRQTPRPRARHGGHRLGEVRTARTHRHAHDAVCLTRPSKAASERPRSPTLARLFPKPMRKGGQSLFLIASSRNGRQIARLPAVLLYRLQGARGARQAWLVAPASMRCVGLVVFAEQIALQGNAPVRRHPTACRLRSELAHDLGIRIQAHLPCCGSGRKRYR